MNTYSEMGRFRTLAVCALSVCLLSVPAYSQLYIFAQITGDSLDCPDAFTMEVVEQGDQALFTFTNNCDNDGVLGRIFVRENDLITFNSVFDQPEGVSFSSPVKENAMLPGGKGLGFTPHNTYSINADPARPKNGLHYEDYVSILFDLNNGVVFDDVIADLDAQLLGVGIHAQSLPGGTSAAFATVPEPATLALIGIGTLLIRNRKRGTAHN